MKHPILSFSCYVYLGLICASFLSLTGCYVIQQGTILLSYHSRAVPVEELLTQTETEPETKTFLSQVQDIRTFATEELGLMSNTNYTTYVELDRQHLAYVVSASDAVSFTPYEWWFPIVGKVPYKGFFREPDARKEAQGLRQKGWDVWVRRVDAFSTLGYFSDPLYSFMKTYPLYQIAELIIHEQAHATLYVKGQSRFNEEFATFIGKQGSRAYLISRFGEASAEYRAKVEAEQDQQVFIKSMQDLIQRLEALYRTGLPKEQMLQQKDQIIQKFKEEFLATYSEKFQTEAYKKFAELPINNAYLFLYRLYYPEESFFETLYEQSGKNLKTIIQAAKQIRGKKGDPYKLMEQALSTVSTNPSGHSRKGFNEQSEVQTIGPASSLVRPSGQEKVQ